MKLNITFSKHFKICLLLFSTTVFGQVGIGTNTPKGALDINSTNAGLVYPVVNLVDINTPTISNPNGGGPLLAGTTVYNNVTSGTAENRVYPGIYVWNGDLITPKWIPQFSKRDQKLFLQNADLRTLSTNTPEKQVIPFPSTSFTPKYSGRYKVEVKVHYAGGAVDVPPASSSGGQQNRDWVNFNAQKGKFEFVFNSKTKTFDIQSYSADNRRYSPYTYTNAASQLAYVTIETLTQGTPYSFALTCDQQAAEGFIDNGNGGSGGSGRGYITLNGAIKCLVEITYIGD